MTLQRRLTRLEATQTGARHPDADEAFAILAAWVEAATPDELRAFRTVHCNTTTR